MIKKVSLVQVMLIMLFLNISAQEKHVMDLIQMLEFAKQNNYEIKEANIDRLKSAQKIKEVRGKGFPQIESGIEYKDYFKMPTMLLPGELMGVEDAPDMAVQFGTKYNLDASIQFSQLLFSLSYIQGLKVAKKASEIRSLEVEKANIEMIQLVVSEYFNLMAIYKNLEIIESNMNSLDQTRQKIKSLVEEGMALKTDLKRIDINYANLEVSKEQILSGIKVQINNIKYIIGLGVDDQLEVDTTNFKNTFSADALLIRSCQTGDLDPENLTEIKLLNKSIELNKLQVKTAKSEALPNVALFGSHTFQAQRNEFNFTAGDEKWFDVTLIGLKATIPIFSGLTNQAKIKIAKYNVASAFDQREHALAGLNIQYMNALMQYNSSVRNCLIQLENIDLAKDVKQQEELKYNQGVSTLTDLLIAQKELRNTQINYVQNFISMKQAEVDLLKSRGVLSIHWFENK